MEKKVFLRADNKLNANLGKSTLSASIAPRFCRKFAQSVSWQRVDERTGAKREDDEKGTVG